MGDVYEKVVNMQEIANVDFLYYRIRGSGRLYRRLDVELVTGEKFSLYENSINQFIKYLDIGYRNLIAIKDWRERNAILMDAIRNADSDLTFSYVVDDRGRNRVIRVVSSKFIAIPHRFVVSAVEEALSGAGIFFERDIRYDNGMYATWDFEVRDAKTVGEPVLYRIWVYNRNDGTHGLKIGTGARILVCSNGLIRWKGNRHMRIVHRTELEAVREKIVALVSEYIDSVSEIKEIIENAKGVIVPYSKIEKYIRELHVPKWVKDVIRHHEDIERCRREGYMSLWHLSQVLTYVATHQENITMNYRVYLSREGGRVIEDNKVIEILSS